MVKYRATIWSFLKLTALYLTMSNIVHKCIVSKIELSFLNHCILFLLFNSDFYQPCLVTSILKQKEVKNNTSFRHLHEGVGNRRQRAPPRTATALHLVRRRSGAQQALQVYLGRPYFMLNWIVLFPSTNSLWQWSSKFREKKTVYELLVRKSRKWSCVGG